MNNQKIDLSKYQNKLGFKSKANRLLWNLTCMFLFKPFGSLLFRRWRIFVLNCFGAKIHSTANIYSSVKIWAPWNLEMGSYSCLAPHVDFYNTDLIKIGNNSTVSQKCYICAASHDITHASIPLITAQIIIEDQVWIAADAFIGMGVTIGQGAVVGARASVFKDVEPWTVVGGNPARFIKKREIKG